MSLPEANENAGAKFLRLAPGVILRGWDYLPYAAVNVRGGEPIFLRHDEFSFLENALTKGFSGKMPGAIAGGVKRGFWTVCAQGAPLTERQKYLKHDCRYLRCAHWSITGKCNLKCRHCCLEGGRGAYGELSFDDCLKIIDNLKEAGVTEVLLSGGEPLARRDMWDIVDAILDGGISIPLIYTNGTLVGGRFLDECDKRRIGWNFIVSFDGVGFHDWMRGEDGAETRTLEAVRRIKERGYYARLATTVQRGSLSCLGATYDLLKTLGVDSWEVFPALDRGSWALRDKRGEKEMSAVELFDAYLEIIRAHQADGMPFNLMLNGFFIRNKGEKQYISQYNGHNGTERALRDAACQNCRNTIYIMPDGKVIPCIPMSGTDAEKNAPNILETPLTEIMSERSYLFGLINTRVGDILERNPECAACEHRLRCGSCRACVLQYGGGGDYYGTDRMACAFWKGGYMEKIARAVGAASPVSA